jgi:hypothetical protein
VNENLEKCTKKLKIEYILVKLSEENTKGVDREQCYSLIEMFLLETGKMVLQIEKEL